MYVYVCIGDDIDDDLDDDNDDTHYTYTTGINTQLAAAATLLGPINRVLLSLRPPTTGVINGIKSFCSKHDSEFNELRSSSGSSSSNSSSSSSSSGWMDLDDYDLAYLSLFHQGALATRVMASRMGYEGIEAM